MKSDSQASLLASTFATPCLHCEPKAKVAKILNPTFILEWIIYFFHIFSIIKVEEFAFNILKPLLTNYILHLLLYIKTHVIQYFVIIFEWFNEFFHIYWTINIFTWIKSFILNLLKSLFKRCILHLLIYIETHIII